MADVGEPWSILRALRAAPPGRAGTDADRRVVFAAALEQAEQFLAAAATVGYATKPVQLFYALSQAGRAIAAVLADQPWEIRGHGASVSASPQITSTTIKPGTSPVGALGLVAEATGSELWEGPVSLAALWASLPELPATPAMTGPADKTLRVEREHVDYSRPAAPFGNTVLTYTTLGPVSSGWSWRMALRLPDRPSDPDELQALVERLLAPYPKAAGWSLSTQVAFGGVSNHPPGTDWVLLEWAYQDGEDGRRVMVAPELLTVQYERSLYFRPGLGATRTIPSSLVTWWGVLLALSSLARYQPVAWRQALEIDHSPIAWALERGLQIAEQRIPELVLNAVADRARSMG